MTNIEWTVENEIQLFYAMMHHKPVGKLKSMLIPGSVFIFYLF